MTGTFSVLFHTGSPMASYVVLLSLAVVYYAHTGTTTGRGSVRSSRWLVWPSTNRQFIRSSTSFLVSLYFWGQKKQTSNSEKDRHECMRGQLITEPTNPWLWGGSDNTLWLTSPALMNASMCCVYGALMRTYCSWWRMASCATRCGEVVKHPPPQQCSLWHLIVI